MSRGFGVAAGLDPEVARPLAARCAELGYESVWSNDHPGAKGLETLAEIGKRLGRKALAQVACVAKPDTILAWYRKLVAQKFDGSKHRSYPGRPRISPEVDALIVQFARENAGWGYDRIVGALAHLGHTGNG